MKKKWTILLLFSLLTVFSLAACGKSNKENSNNPNFDSETYLSGYYYAQMDIENYGAVTMMLNADAAPATVTNFVNLVNAGFYNGLTFHRIIDGFMIQGGDPMANGTGGSNYNVPGEFALNGYENPISHVRGTISMARAKSYDSASSQFFIVQEDTTALDGSYAAFGNVIEGMEIIDAICANTSVEDDNGTVLPANQPVITSISIIAEIDVDADGQENTSPEANLPKPSAVLTFSMTDSVEGLSIANTITVNDDGKHFLLLSSEDLLSLGIYEVDLANGIVYDKEKPLGYAGDIAAGSYVSIRITVPEDSLNILLAAEEHNGAIGKYLICYDSSNGGAYLVPIVE